MPLKKSLSMMTAAFLTAATLTACDKKPNPPDIASSHIALVTDESSCVMLFGLATRNIKGSFGGVCVDPDTQGIISAVVTNAGNTRLSPQNTQTLREAVREVVGDPAFIHPSAGECLIDGEFKARMMTTKSTLLCGSQDGGVRAVIKAEGGKAKIDWNETQRRKSLARKTIESLAHGL